MKVAQLFKKMIFTEKPESNQNESILESQINK